MRQTNNPFPPRARPAAKAAPSGDATALEKLVAAAKGYRPLYHLLETRISEAAPDDSQTVHDVDNTFTRALIAAW